MRRTAHTPGGRLSVRVDPGTAYRVGYRPEPWAWTPWQYADTATGRFGGRWDDSNGLFRTVYAGASLLGCLLEVLARFRPDPLLAADLGLVVVDDQDAVEHPTVPPGAVPTSWLTPRAATRATLSGAYCVVADLGSIPTLRSRFLHTALGHGLGDLDAGALRLSAPRGLTQQVATWLYDLDVEPFGRLDGIQFDSRHGDRLTLWAIFERPGPQDQPVSARLGEIEELELTPDHPQLRRTFRTLGLTWHQSRD